MMKRLAAVGFTTLVLACGDAAAQRSTTAPPQPTVQSSSTPTSASFAKQFDTYVSSLGDGIGIDDQFWGFVLVAQGDKIVYERAWGFADRGTKQRADRHTSFRIGSVTKQFTAVAILQLQEKGLLSVHDKIRKHLPNYPAVADDITIHHLLTHTSGIPNYTADKALMERRADKISVADLLATFSSKELEFAPGTKFSYSNSGYSVLGAIIEAVSNKTYGDYMRDHVFAPAGLKRTHYGDAPQLNNRAMGYRVIGGKLVPAKNSDMSVAFAAGGIRSTAADLWRWHEVIETDIVLSAASRKQMYTPAKKHHAYGWIVRDIEDKRLVAHDGGIDGFSASYLRLLTDDITVVTWANNQDADAGALARAAMKIVLGKKFEPVASKNSARH